MVMKRTSGPTGPRWHANFLKMLPAIDRRARFAFRSMETEAAEEALAEAIALAMAAYIRLVEKQRTADAFPTTLTRWAIAQVRQGRHLGGRLNNRDVLSRYARRKRGGASHGVARWDEMTEERSRASLRRNRSPADEAAFRVDFTSWLDTLAPRDHRLAVALATGERVKAVAKALDISAARVCQIRRKLRLSWQEFHGEKCG